MSSSSSAPDYHSTSVPSASRRRRRRSRILEPTTAQQLHPQPLPFCDGFELLRLDPTKVSSSSQSSSAGSRQQPSIAAAAAAHATSAVPIPGHATTSGSTSTANVVLAHVRSLLSCAGVVDYTAAARPNFNHHADEQEDQNEEYEPDEYNVSNDRLYHHSHQTSHPQSFSHKVNPRGTATAVPSHPVNEYYYQCYHAPEEDCISLRNANNDHEELRDDTLYCGNAAAASAPRNHNPYWNPATTACPPMASSRFSSHYPFSGTATVASQLDQLTTSIHNLQRIALTGPRGTPMYGACSLSQGQMLPPAGRWKFTLAAPTSIVLPISPLSTTQPLSKEVRLSAPQLLSCELRIGDHCHMPLFLPQSSVTLFEYDQQAHTLTVTIAPPQSSSTATAASDGWSPRSKESSSSLHSHQQLAVIAVLHPVSKRYCHAVGLVQSGNVAVLHRVCDLLEEWAPTACFTIWSLGIPSTLLSETLVANILALPVDGCGGNGLDPNHPPTSVR
jgi:hypothetical protein